MFRDPAPDWAGSSGGASDDNPNLLGVRIDISTRHGQFVKPYYVLLKQERKWERSGYNEGGGEEDEEEEGDGVGNEARTRTHTRLRVHRHTIPAFISMEKLARLYLPFPKDSRGNGNGNGNDNDEMEESELAMKPWKKTNDNTNPTETRKQDLNSFVISLRRELSSWHIRMDAVDMLRENLGLPTPTTSTQEEGRKEEEERNGNDEERSSKADEHRHHSPSPRNTLGVISLCSTSLEARYIRLEWESGRVGQFKLTNSGTVERAVIIDNDNRRDKVIENALVGGDGRVEGVLNRLESLVS